MRPVARIEPEHRGIRLPLRHAPSCCRRTRLFRHAPAIRVVPRIRSASRANYASNRKRSANRIQHYFLRWPRILQITANIFKNIAFIRFNFVSYNQKKFDTSLSFLIPSDASNLTHCSLRNRFRSTFFRFRRTEVPAAGRIVRAPAMQYPDAFHWTTAIRQRAEGSNQMSRTTKLLL
ncbi:hypothetical protein [Burkholderia cepacia]|uniref:hypothetical protein n=1 Tax=Burkholderia cepacia TaxID=292 RepID=UPI001E3A7751|nr:hypothetical protein [Burkholderia cepacia]